MSRINYSDNEEYPGQFELWQANCQRSLRGARGQRELRELEAALLALPEKRLIHGAAEENGEVCAIACYGQRKGVDLSKFHAYSESDRIGVAGGMPRLVAWKVVEMNDEEFDRETPEQRYEKMFAWVRSQLVQENRNVG